MNDDSRLDLSDYLCDSADEPEGFLRVCERLAVQAQDKAVRNVSKWGWQTPETLALAIAEECGEIAQALLKARHEGQPLEAVQRECDDLAPLCFQLWYSVQRARFFGREAQLTLETPP